MVLKHGYFALTPATPALPQVYVPPHPLVKHWLAVARNAATPGPTFRSALSELGRILIYEAVREILPTVEGVIETPMGPADVEIVDPMRPIKVCCNDSWQQTGRILSYVLQPMPYLLLVMGHIWP